MYNIDSYDDEDYDVDGDADDENEMTPDNVLVPPKDITCNKIQLSLG